jgi:2-dehydropantoate 2-reductase
MTPFFIAGAGGIGCVLGYALRAAGAAVVFVDADPEKVAWGRSNGVQIDGLPPLAADFIPFAEWQPPADSTVLLCTKCYDNAAVLARLPASVCLVPVQNGFDPDLARRGHAVEGVASFVSECTPGTTHTRLTRPGKLHLGFRTAGGDRRVLSALARPLRHGPGYGLVKVPDVLPYKYTKLMYNAAISPVAAAAGLDNGSLLSVPAARRLFFDLLRENYDILRAAGVPLSKVGPFHPTTVAKILRCRPLANALSWAFYPSLRGTYCSMSGDLPRGRTEIDYYNRHLIELAGERPCPWNRRVVDLVKRMERDGTPPGLERLDELPRPPDGKALLAPAGRPSLARGVSPGKRAG